MDDFNDAFKRFKQFYNVEPGFQDGGSVTTPKRGLVDEPGSYAGEHGPYIYEKTSQGGKPIYELEVREQIGGKRKVIRRKRLPRTEENLKILKNIRDTDPKLAKYIKPALYADDDYLKLRFEHSDKNQKQFADFLNKETDFRPVNGGKFSESKVKNMDNKTKYVSQTKFRIPESTRASIIEDFKTGKYSMMELGRKYFPDDPVDKFIKGQRVSYILNKEGLDTSKFKTEQIDPNKSKYEYQYERKREITRLLKKAGKKTKEQYFTLENQILAGNEEILKLSDDEILSNKKIMNALNIDASKDNLAKGKITFDKYKNLSPEEQVAKVRELAKKRLFIQPEHIRSVYTGQQNIVYPNNLQSAPGKIGSYMENIKEYIRKNPDGKAIPEIEKLFKDYDMGVDEGGKKVGFKNIIYNSEKGSSNIVDGGLFKVLGEKANIKRSDKLKIFRKSQNEAVNAVENLPKDKKIKICNALSNGGLPGDCANAIKKDPIKTSQIIVNETKNLKTAAGAKALKAGRTLLKFGVIGEGAFVGADAGIRAYMGRPKDEAFLAATFREGKADDLRKKRAGFTDREFLVDKATNLSNKINSLQQQIFSSEREGTDTKSLENILKKTVTELQKPFDRAGTKLVDLLDPSSATNISYRRKMENIMDSDRAKSMLTEGTARDVDRGIPNIADYGEVDAGVTKRTFAPREALPSDDNFFANYFNDELMKNNIRYEDIKDDITPMQKFQIKSQYPEFDEQNYGTQGRFAGGGLAKLAGKRSGTPPESGPTPQGLDYLLKRGRQY